MYYFRAKKGVLGGVLWCYGVRYLFSFLGALGAFVWCFWGVCF